MKDVRTDFCRQKKKKKKFVYVKRPMNDILLKSVTSVNFFLEFALKKKCKKSFPINGTFYDVNLFNTESTVVRVTKLQPPSSHPTSSNLRHTSLKINGYSVRTKTSSKSK